MSHKRLQLSATSHEAHGNSKNWGTDQEPACPYLVRLKSFAESHLFWHPNRAESSHPQAQKITRFKHDPHFWSCNHESSTSDYPNLPDLPLPYWQLLCGWSALKASTRCTMLTYVLIHHQLVDTHLVFIRCMHLAELVKSIHHSARFLY